MTWTQNGIDYVCQKYGDINECVISGGLVFDVVDIQGQTTTGLTGSTADIVAMITFNLITQITMTTPSRPSISDPFTKLNNANGGSVTPTDAQELTSHDENSGDQWCYAAPIPCEQHTTQQLCEAAACYWYNNSCHSSPPVCENYTTQAECEAEGCYWYNNSCHSALPSCEILQTSEECSRYNCYWYNNSCHSSPPPVVCESYTTQAECEAAGCYWYDSSCHSTPQPQPPEIPWAIIGVGLACVTIAAIIIIKKRR